MFFIPHSTHFVLFKKYKNTADGGGFAKTISEKGIFLMGNASKFAIL
jgi:hypothetical protein